VLGVHFDLDGTPEVSPGDRNGGDQPGSAQLSQSRHEQHRAGLDSRQTSQADAAPLNSVT
jgi:hypothetical protein